MTEPTSTEWECEHCKSANDGERTVGTACWKCGLWQGYDYSKFPAVPRGVTSNAVP